MAAYILIIISPILMLISAALFANSADVSARKGSSSSEARWLLFGFVVFSVLGIMAAYAAGSIK